MEQTLSSDLPSSLSREVQFKRSPIFPKSWKARSTALSKLEGPCQLKVFVARFHLKIEFGSQRCLLHGAFHVYDVVAACVEPRFCCRSVQALLLEQQIYLLHAGP